MIIIIRLFFWSALINRGNKVTTFEQCQCALIIRGKLINLQKLEEFFDKFSFKEIFNICNHYFLEVSFFISVLCLIWSLGYCLLYCIPRLSLLEWTPVSGIYKYTLEEAPVNLDERRVKIFSNYFHEEISSVFPIKICYFDKDFGTWLTVLLLYFNAIACFSYGSAPALVSGRNSIQQKLSRDIFVLYRSN